MTQKYKIVVNEVNDVQPTMDRYQHNQTKELISYSDFYALSESRRAEFTHVNLPTGKKAFQTGELVYEQTIDDLDLKDLIKSVNSLA